MKKTLLTMSLLGVFAAMDAQTNITEQMLKRFQESGKLTSTEKAVHNALATTDVRVLALNHQNQREMDTHFSHSVPSKGITDQKSSGRCWLFTGLNVLRSRMIIDNGLNEMEFSQIYLFFYDQLEKSNLFLQAIIDTRKLPLADKTVEWLFRNPLSDGGTFTGVADLVAKYGVVPKGCMPETFSSDNTSRFTSLVKRKLREGALKLRDKSADGAKEAELLKMKEDMLAEVYKMLVLAFGEPVNEFLWAPKDAKGKYLSEPKKYTPKTFYEEMIGEDMQTDYVMLMNDPTREYWKTYEIEYDRHTYDGHNWLYLNLPIEEVKRAAIESIKDSTMMYFSCDVSKELDSKRGLLDMANYDYESVFGVDFGMNKKQRVQTFDSGSSHAMTLMAVDLDEKGTPIKWKVENSWGAASGHFGHLIMTDEWFDEYMFRLVVKRKYLSDKVLKAAQLKPVKLPCWDPMFMGEE